jgi:hypothetical protein
VSDWIIEPLYFGFTDGETPAETSVPSMDGLLPTDGKHKSSAIRSEDRFFPGFQEPVGVPRGGDEVLFCARWRRSASRPIP